MVLFLAQIVLGGSALAGHTENGRFYLAGGGVHTEVSARVFCTMRGLEITEIFSYILIITVVVITAVAKQLGRRPS